MISIVTNDHQMKNKTTKTRNLRVFWKKFEDFFFKIFLDTFLGLPQPTISPCYSSVPYQSIMEECKVASAIRVKCEPSCVGFKKALDACAARLPTVQEKHPEANCELQYFDMQACLDKCVCNSEPFSSFRPVNGVGSLSQFYLADFCPYWF
jgi:hypothetical protein